MPRTKAVKNTTLGVGFFQMPLYINWLDCNSSKVKVPGSSPGRGDFFIMEFLRETLLYRMSL